jgi:hypothetical protein
MRGIYDMNIPLSPSEILQIIGFFVAGGFAYSRIMSRLEEGDKRFERIEQDIRSKQQELDVRVRGLESTERVNGLALQEVKTEVKCMTRALEKMEEKLDTKFGMMFDELRSKVDLSVCNRYHNEEVRASS